MKFGIEKRKAYCHLQKCNGISSGAQLQVKSEEFDAELTVLFSQSCKTS